MHKYIIRACLVLALAFAFACGGDPDPGTEGGVCKASATCDAGLSCLVNKCIKERSLDAGMTCSEDCQCKSDDCDSQPFVCR